MADAQLMPPEFDMSRYADVAGAFKLAPASSQVLNMTQATISLVFSAGWSQRELKRMWQDMCFQRCLGCWWATALFTPAAQRLTPPDCYEAWDHYRVLRHVGHMKRASSLIYLGQELQVHLLPNGEGAFVGMQRGLAGGSTDAGATWREREAHKICVLCTARPHRGCHAADVPGASKRHV